MSEITLADLENYSAQDISNKIRALQDPYPNAYIRCANNTRLLLQSATVGEEDE